MIKRKPRTMTVNNYKEFLPSEMIRSFVTDIDVALKAKKHMNMGIFNFVGSYSNCLPCLGGLACMNMGYENIYSSPLSKTIAYLGDAIRRESSTAVQKYLAELYPDLITEIYRSEIKMKKWGSVLDVGPEKLRRLQTTIHHLADSLKMEGI